MTGAEVIDFVTARQELARSGEQSFEVNPSEDQPSRKASSETPLPPPNLAVRDYITHVSIARLFDLDPRYSLEAQGLVYYRMTSS